MLGRLIPARMTAKGATGGFAKVRGQSLERSPLRSAALTLDLRLLTMD
jgi:hypothetical protein